MCVRGSIIYVKKIMIYRDDVDKSGLARVLKAHKGELHLLLPEQALDPVDDRVEEVDNGCHFLLFVVV